MKQRCASTHLHAATPLQILRFYSISCQSRGKAAICVCVKGLQSGELLLSLFRYFFMYSSFAFGVNSIYVMVCCCRRAGLNLHVLDDKYPKTKMLIAPTNQHSRSSRCHHRNLYGPAIALRALTLLISYPPPSLTGAGDDSIYSLHPPRVQDLNIHGGR